MKKKIVYIVLSLGLLNFAQLSLLCSENDLVNYVVNASQESFENGLNIWQEPYRNLPSFKSDQSRLHQTWLQGQQIIVETVQAKVEVVVEVEAAELASSALIVQQNVSSSSAKNVAAQLVELVSPSSVFENNNMMSPDRNACACASHEDEEEGELSSTSKLQYVSKSKLKRIRQKNNLAAKKHLQDVDTAFLDEEISKNKIIDAAKTLRNREIFERAMNFGNDNAANADGHLAEMIKTSSMIQGCLMAMAKDVHTCKRADFWRADGSPIIYMVIDHYIKDGGIITIDMMEALESFRKETLKIKIKFYHNREHEHYKFADINNAYANLMKAKINKKDSQEIDDLFEKCSSVLSSSLSSTNENFISMVSKVVVKKISGQPRGLSSFLSNENVAIMVNQIAADQFSNSDAALSHDDLDLLKKDNFLDNFMSRYQTEVQGNEDPNGFFSESTECFRSKALLILQEFHIEHPEPYVQALQKIKKSAARLKSSFTSNK